jgi:hypothetical protein
MVKKGHRRSLTILGCAESEESEESPVDSRILLNNQQDRAVRPFAKKVAN